MPSPKQKNQLNEKDTLTDMLLIEKSLVKVYATALTEAATKNVRTTFKNNFTGATSDQYNLFCTMSESGYYEPAPADKAVVDKQKDTFETVKKQLQNA